MELVSDYDYCLPEELIAQTPLPNRTDSLLLHIDKCSGAVTDSKFSDCHQFLREGDLLVLNDTQVSARRLIGSKDSGGAIELLLLAPCGENRFRALAKPAKSLTVGRVLHFESELSAVVVEVLEEGERVVEFSSIKNLESVLFSASTIPLPPYIRVKLEDENRYQTVFATQPGSAAAPTAALHFDQPTLNLLEAKGVDIATVTLDVGLDTFRPIKSDTTDQHQMHGEKCTIPPETAEKIANANGRIVAVGTTTVRTLESHATARRSVADGAIHTRIFIKPGYEFQIVDGVFTNFHLPRTTMLMMVSAMIGRENLLKAYEHAIEQKYRFLSFGDSMLIL